MPGSQRGRSSWELPCLYRTAPVRPGNEGTSGSGAAWRTGLSEGGASALLFPAFPLPSYSPYPLSCPSPPKHTSYFLRFTEAVSQWAGPVTNGRLSGPHCRGGVADVDTASEQQRAGDRHPAQSPCWARVGQKHWAYSGCPRSHSTGLCWSWTEDVSVHLLLHNVLMSLAHPESWIRCRS